MNKIAVLFISNQLCDENTSRIKKIQESLENLDSENKYDVYWCYDKDDEYWKITSESNDINFYVVTQKELKAKYRKIFYNWANNFNVSLFTCSFYSKHNDYDYIWTIEDDVIVRDNYWEFLFNGFDNNTSDLLGTHISHYNEVFFDKKNHLNVYFEFKWDFDYRKIEKEYNIEKWITAFIPINRLSKRALKYINDYYTRYNGFFEIIIPTLLYNNGYVIEDISYPSSEFTKEENYNKYYLTYKTNYEDINNNFSTVCWSEKFYTTIDEIPTGVLMHPIKWWKHECEKQNEIVLKNTGDIGITHYIAYHDKSLLNGLFEFDKNIKLYDTTKQLDVFNLNHLNKFIGEYSMFYWIWKYDKVSEYISTNTYKYIFDIDNLSYDKLKVDTCVISQYIHLPECLIHKVNPFGIRKWADKTWINCEWLWEDMKDYLNMKYGEDNEFIKEDFAQEKKRFFIQRSCFIMPRLHFNNLCDYIFGFLDYLDNKYSLNYEYDKYEKFIKDKFILPNKGDLLKCYNVLIDENNDIPYRLLGFLFEWMSSIYITSHFTKIYDNEL